MDSGTISSNPNDNTSKGGLVFNITSTQALIPIENATINIYSSSDPTRQIEQIRTNDLGETDRIELPAPPLEYSEQPDEPRPYTDYNFEISAPNYEPVFIEGAQILPDVTAVQPVTMNPVVTSNEPQEDINIPDHTLYGDYPPKIPEDEVKPMDESGEIVLSRVVLPEYVVVHDGVPSNSSAPNYYIRYTDYIKNVASSEIYATWPENTIYANVLAIMSFTLNRVYTEWYRNQGYNFTITSSTAYDQKFMYGRNIYENISQIVDSIFNNFVSRPGIRQPLFTSYCNGTTVTCSGLSQWGSKYLGDEGYTAIEILRYYYGNNVYINSTDYVSGVPSSWPGSNLSRGSRSDKVRQMQEQLNRIAQNYPLIPRVSVDGIYGPGTEEAVKVFQKVFGLPQTGVVDFPTWYKISQIFVGVSRISEPS